MLLLVGFARADTLADFQRLSQQFARQFDAGEYQQAEQTGSGCQQRQGGRQRAGLDQMTAPILKIGRYIAMTRPPTSTPRMAMIIGSSRLLMLSTALSTSAS